MTREDKKKRENSTALIIHFAERREHAAHGPWDSGVLELVGRPALISQAWRAEWEGLFTVLAVPHLAALHDVQMLHDRIEAMRRRMLVDPSFVSHIH